MKTMVHSFLTALGLAALLLSGCGPLPHEPLFAITSPHQDDSLPANQPVTIRMDAFGLAHPNPCYDHYEYSVADNGTQFVNRTFVPVSEEHPYEIIVHPYNGVHWVDVHGRLAWRSSSCGGREYSEWINRTVCFWVGPDRPPDICSTRTIAEGVRQSTPTPAPTPTPVPVILELDSYPDPVYYGDTCPALSSVALRAALAVPQGVAADQLDVKAHVSVRVGSTSGEAGSMVVQLQPTQSWDASTGGQLFEGSLDFSRSFNDATGQFSPAALAGASGAVLWHVEVSRGAALLETSHNEVIDLAPCPTQGQTGGRHTGGSGSAGGSNSPGGSGCGQYTNQVSCNLAGCSWIPQSSSCVVSP
jgi:hypothetical protein